MSDGKSTLVCGTDYKTQEDSVVLTASLALYAEVMCNGSYVVTAADIDNLERASTASVTAMDDYMTEVEAEAAVNVGLDQVRAQRSF